MFSHDAFVFQRGHTDLNHGPIGLQPIALPLSYIPTVYEQISQKQVDIVRLF